MNIHNHIWLPNLYTSKKSSVQLVLFVEFKYYTNNAGPSFDPFFKKEYIFSNEVQVIFCNVVYVLNHDGIVIYP